MSARLIAPLALALLVAACGSTPKSGTEPTAEPTKPAARTPTRKPNVTLKRGGGYYKDDGPAEDIPDGLDDIPDAEPKPEPLHRFANKPYVVLGKEYVPNTSLKPYRARGIASWYGKKFHGQKTSIGEPYDMFVMTAAHKTLPIPSYARVRNPANGREVIVRVNDRGPFHPGRIVDLSYTAALKLDILRGVTPVEVERITYEDIRTGAWQRRDEGTRLAQARDARPGATPAPAAPQAAATTLPATPPAGAVTAISALPQDLTPTPAPGAVSLPIPEGGTAPKAASKGFWVQLGAFNRMDGAEAFRQRLSQELDWLSPLLAIFKEAQMHRLQAGPYASREDARTAAERMRQALALTPLIVERR